jgi:hypothetical protein
MAGSGVAVGHCGFLQSLQRGMERGGVVSLEGADIIRAENRDEEEELALIDKFIQRDKKGERIDRDAGGRDSDEKGNGLRKDGVEDGLGI